MKLHDLDEVAYIHEMALTHAIMDYFSDIQRLKDYQKIEHVNEINKPIIEEKSIAFKNFLDTLYYYLKFRRCDAQSIELMLLAFQAGKIVFSD